MAAPSLEKIAYHTLQQGKSLAGLAHKELSTKLMEVFAPEVSAGKLSIDRDLIKDVIKSMKNLFPMLFLYTLPLIVKMDM